MKLFSWQIMRNILAAVVALLLASPVFALGLGNIEVHSYLNQPLLARIPLISQSGEELGTVTAGMASAADLEMMGLSRTVSVPLHFNIITEAGNAYVEVSSRLAITEPVIQLVVEVRWSGGRMLREYTLFMDPPTIAAQAPRPMVLSQPARPPAENYPDPALQDVVETVKPQLAPVTVIQEVPAPQASVSEPLVAASATEDLESVVELPASATDVDPRQSESRQTVTVPADPVLPDDSERIPGPVEIAEQAGAEIAEEPAVEFAGDAEAEIVEEPAVEIADGPVTEAVEEPVAEITSEATVDDVNESEAQVAHEAEDQVPAPEEPVTDESFADAEAGYQAGEEIVGPVQRGQTLWGIATRYNSGSSYSINQAMLAIQRLNPDAFGGNNINFLHRGAILRMPTMSEMARLNKRQAMLEAMRQEQAYAAMRAGQPYDSLPTISDHGIPELAATEVEKPVFSTESDLSPESRLQLVPPSQQADQAAGGSGPGEAAVGAVSSQDIQEVLSRTEEELANAQQENAYLNERIRELETKISEQQQDGLVTDNSLAEMEQNLRESRLSGEETPAAQQASPVEEKPWYLANPWWAGGLLLLLIAAVVWLLRKLGSTNHSGPDNDETPEQIDATVKVIRSEAEEILKTLDEPANEASRPDNVVDLENYSDPVTASEKSEIPVKDGKKAKIIPIADENAVELDGDDPEVKLDLARAYLSMGDKDAAREMLEEVIDSGDEAQAREANEMMNEL